jgi:hypothetical protein
MRKSKTVTIKVRGIDLNWMDYMIEKDDMDEEELFSCLVRMAAPATCENCDELTDEQVGYMVRKARELYLENRELTV